MGQCSCTDKPSSRRISIKKMMRNTLQQFFEKTEYLVESCELLLDAFEHIKTELFEILSISNIANLQTDRLDQNRSTISYSLLHLSLDNVPQFLMKTDLIPEQEEQLLKVAEKFRESYKCAKALRNSCCKALQRQEIGWQNYELFSSASPNSPQKSLKNNNIEEATSPSKSSIFKFDNVYQLRRDLCARKLLLVIQNVDELLIACNFDELLEALKTKLEYKYKIFFAQNYSSEQDNNKVAVIDLQEQEQQKYQHQQQQLIEIVKDLSTSQVF